MDTVTTDQKPMGFIEKIKLLFKARKPVTDIINEVQTIKAGYKTIPFWVTFLGSAIALVTAVEGVLPVTTALIITTSLTAFYNILRGAAKTDVAGQKPILQTSEFWLSALAQVSSALVALQTGGINPKWITAAISVIGIAMTAGQNLAGQQPTAEITDAAAQPTSPVVPPTPKP